MNRLDVSGKWEIRPIFFKEISSSISLKNQSPRLSANRAGLGIKNRGMSFFIPKVGLISHFPAVIKKTAAKIVSRRLL